MLAALAVVIVLAAGCSGSGGGQDNPEGPVPPSASATAVDHQRADADLILTMYDQISRAFELNADDGVRALIASQYPESATDVDFVRCVNAILPGATTLPPTKRMHFTPNISTMTPDPGYIPDSRVKDIHPQGRIYLTDVTISDGTKPRVMERHQVIFNGQAYQFSSC